MFVYLLTIINFSLGSEVKLLFSIITHYILYINFISKLICNTEVPSSVNFLFRESTLL